MNYLLEIIKNNNDLALIIFCIVFILPFTYAVLKMNSGPGKVDKK